MEKSRLIYDLHTHTTYSHGKGSIADNAAAAAAAGLTVLGIADHGPGHIGFGLDIKKVPQMRADIEALKGRFPGLEVRLGVEANIINPSGELDVSKEEQKLFDFIIAGYHYGTLGEKPVRAAGVMLGGYWHELTGKSSRAALVYNTDLVLSALYSNDIKVLSHPGEKAPFDIDAIAKACEETGTLMEINNKHNCLTVEGIRTAMKYDVSFILGSDAHVPGDVGATNRAWPRVIESGLDTSRIVNLRREADR
jgi:putative hydrolase